MKKNQKRRLVMYFAGLIAAMISVFIFAYFWYTSYSENILNPFYRKGNWLVILIYAIFIYFFFRLYGGFKYGFLTTTNIIYSQALALVISNVIMYMQIALFAREFTNAGTVLMMTATQIVILCVYSVLVSNIYYALYPPRRMIIVYGSSLADSLIAKMSMRKEKYKVCASVSAKEELEVICDKISKYEAVILCDIKSELRNKLLKFCFDRSIRVYLTPKISDIIIRGADDINLFDTPLLLSRNRGLNVEQMFVKRLGDIFLSSIGIIVLSPVMLITAICIKLYDRGPVLYKQTRSTIGGRVFEIYKFRSMIVDAEKKSGAVLASRHDDRITPVGRVIRRYRIDEFPQLFNILLGDMSIVGPRPERPEIGEKYAVNMPEFRYRLKVKAGLTGYAQVVGKYDTTAYDKLKMDMMYIENYSLFLDIRLIMMTIKTMFQKDSSQGVTDSRGNNEEEDNNSN